MLEHFDNYHKTCDYHKAIVNSLFKQMLRSKKIQLNTISMIR